MVSPLGQKLQTENVRLSTVHAIACEHKLGQSIQTVYGPDYFLPGKFILQYGSLAVLALGWNARSEVSGSNISTPDGHDIMSSITSKSFSLPW